MFRCKARKKPNREAYIWVYIERCGLQRNTADERSRDLQVISTAPDTPLVLFGKI
jgi:hypothetical protein